MLDYCGVIQGKDSDIALYIGEIEIKLEECLNYVRSDLCKIRGE